jgi:hypothetical protein
MFRKVLDFFYAVAQWWRSAAIVAAFAGIGALIVRKSAVVPPLLRDNVPAFPQWVGTCLVVLLAITALVLIMRILFAVEWFYGSLLVLFVAGVSLLSPGIYECVLPPKGAYGGLLACAGHTDLPEKLGGELIVACVLALVVDRYIKKKFAEEVTRDLLSFAAGHSLEDSIRKKISELIRAAYVRRNFVIQFRLEDVATDLVRVTMTTTYEVKNLADDRPRYAVRSSIEASRWSMVERPMLREFKLRGSSRWALAGEKLHQRTRQEGPYLFFQRRVHLEPVDGRALEVHTVRSAVYPRDWYYVLDLLGPAITIGVTVEVDRVADFEWHVHFGAGDDLMTQPAATIWAHSGVHLPGQFVRVTWSPRRANP